MQSPSHTSLKFTIKRKKPETRAFPISRNFHQRFSETEVGRSARERKSKRPRKIPRSCQLPRTFDTCETSTPPKVNEGNIKWRSCMRRTTAPPKTSMRTADINRSERATKTFEHKTKSTYHKTTATTVS